jgi:hypothetical protein
MLTIRTGLCNRIDAHKCELFFFYEFSTAFPAIGIELDYIVKIRQNNHAAVMKLNFCKQKKKI